MSAFIGPVFDEVRPVPVRLIGGSHDGESIMMAPGASHWLVLLDGGGYPENYEMACRGVAILSGTEYEIRKVVVRNAISLRAVAGDSHMQDWVVEKLRKEMVSTYPLSMLADETVVVSDGPLDYRTVEIRGLMIDIYSDDRGLPEPPPPEPY